MAHSVQHVEGGAWHRTAWTQVMQVRTIPVPD
jgi:hypothetical protein